MLVSEGVKKQEKASCSYCFWLQQYSSFFLFFSKLCLFIYYNSLNELNIKPIQLFKDRHCVVCKHNFFVVVQLLGNIFLISINVSWGKGYMGWGENTQDGRRSSSRVSNNTEQIYTVPSWPHPHNVFQEYCSTWPHLGVCFRTELPSPW